MWNTNYTMPTLVLLVIITVAFLMRRRLHVRVNYVFGGLLLTDFLTMATDLLSVRMDERVGTFPDSLLWLVNALFFAFFVMRSFYFFLFAIELLNAQEKRTIERIFEFVFLAEEVFLLVACFSGWIFRIEDGAYVSGALYPFINLQFIAWILLAIGMTMKMSRPLNLRKSGIYVYLMILLIGVLLRSLFPHVVIMNLFCLFALQVIYLLYLNPDQFVDNVTFLFNYNGWNRVMNEALLWPDFSMVGFAIRDYDGLRQVRGGQESGAAMQEVGSWLGHTWPKLSPFYLGNGIFVLTSMRRFEQWSVLDAVSRRFEQPWGTEGSKYYLKVNEFILQPDIKVKSSDELRSAIRYAFRFLNSAENIGMTYMDNAYLEKYEHIRSVHEALMTSLANDSLEMFLQPVVNAATGEVEGAEALCRLSDGHGGYISPDEFIPLAIDNGNLDALGHQMFRKACAFLGRTDVQNSRIRWINVNVAPDQFQNPNLLEDFLTVIREYHLSPADIHLEITEESMISRTLLHSAMSDFCDRGFVFAMDDFGSSYSNMIRLQQNHFSSVKIDRDFTRSYFENKTALLPDIISTCHDLDMTVVVEGVETEEMIEEVRRIRGDYIQGYVYSRPIPAEEFAKKYVRTEENTKTAQETYAKKTSEGV